MGILEFFGFTKKKECLGENCKKEFCSDGKCKKCCNGKCKCTAESCECPTGCKCDCNKK